MQTSKEQLLAEVQELESNEIVEQLHSYLLNLKQHARDKALEEALDDIPPMPFRSAEEIEARLQEALCDVREGRTYSQEEVITLAAKWREKA